jgi:hypothetical protein
MVNTPFPNSVGFAEVPIAIFAARTLPTPVNKIKNIPRIALNTRGVELVSI